MIIVSSVFYDFAKYSKNMSFLCIQTLRMHTTEPVTVRNMIMKWLYVLDSPLGIRDVTVFYCL